MERRFGPESGGKSWWNDPRMVERLKLTDDQRKAMDGIMLEHREKLIDLQGNLEKAELAMQPLMSADQPNDGAITAQIDKIAQARADLERANGRFLLAIRDKLTPDQWKQVQASRSGGMHGRSHQSWGNGSHNPGMHGNGMQHPGTQGPGGQGPDGQYHHWQAPSSQTPPPAPPQGAPPTGAGSGVQQ
jgi:Spy/CpxP family protein refolding chaperone